jgi:hypothetical protein
MGADRISDDELTALPETQRLRANAKRIVADALARYDGPCPHAYADVVSAYVSAPPGGRDALFLAVAYQAVGSTTPKTRPAAGVRPIPDSALLQESGRAVLIAWVRSALGLRARPTQQERS